MEIEEIIKMVESYGYFTYEGGAYYTTGKDFNCTIDFVGLHKRLVLLLFKKVSN